MFKFAERAKAYVALVGAVLTALSASTGVLPAGAKPYVALGLALVTAFATFQIPNAAAAPAVDENVALD